MGYKQEQFVDKVDENLICSICHEVFEDPVGCKDGHTFCKDCIHEWLKTNRKCPLDNSYLSKFQLVPHFTVKGIIDNLEFFCHPRTQDKLSEVKDFELRCDWVNKLQHLTHHRKTCPFKEVQCSHVKCNQKVQRRELEQHKTICDFRKVECEKCGMVLFQNAKEKHIRDDCLQALNLCPNLCPDDLTQLLKRIKRIDLADHLSKVCPKALVDCPYQEQGCVEKVVRQDVEKHVQENMAAHMMLLAKECSLLRKQNKSLTDQCSSLVCKNTEVKKELKSVTDQCSSLVCKNTEGKKELKLLTQQCSSLAFQNAQLNKELRQVKINLEDIQSGIPNTYMWNIHDFRSQAKKRHLHYFSSPTFWLCGYCWYLQVYPYGQRENKGYMTVYLYAFWNDSTHGTSMVVVPNGEIPVFFRLKVLSQNLFIPDESREKSEIFSYEEPIGHGWDIMETDRALSTAYCNSTNGILTIQCTIQLLAR